MGAIRVLEKKETEIEVGAIFEANVREFSKSNSSFWFKNQYKWQEEKHALPNR